MAAKTDKLTQRIQDLQKFIAPRSNQHPDYAAIAQSLPPIATSLKAGKLTLTLCSQSPNLTEALKNGLSVGEPKLDTYQLQPIDFPSDPKGSPNQPTATITVQTTTSTQQLSLTPGQTATIGRRPDCTIVIPDAYNRVSGQHSEIRPTNDPQTWEICDLNSRNGTFVNGQQLSGCRTLTSDDRITLAYPSGGDKSAELHFQIHPPAPSTNPFPQQLVNTDVFCLVLSATQPLSPAEQQLIQAVNQAAPSKFFITMDTPRLGSEWEAATLSSAATIATWLQTQNLSKSIELVTLALGLFDPSRPQGTMIDPSAQPDLVQFRQTLDRLTTNGQAEEHLIKRLNIQLHQCISQVEAILRTQDTEINQTIAAIEQELATGSEADLREQTRKACKKASDERDKFFRQVRIDLAQSKTDLLDKHRKNSILNKIQDFTESLQAIVTKRNGQSYLQLFSTGTTDADGVNSALTHLCRSELIQWGNEEWRKVNGTYSEGGLTSLIQRLHKILSLIPSLQLTDDLSQPIQRFDPEPSLQASVVEYQNQIPYEETSLPGYLFKNIRSQITAISSLIVLGGTAVAATDEIKRIMPQIVGALIPLVIGFLVYSYLQEKQKKLNDEGIKLREKASSNYQDLAKGFVDRLNQSITLRLDAEDRRLREAIETVDEQFRHHLVNQDRNQASLKVKLTEQKTQQSSLKREQTELDKLKIS
jgi:hypothetical protein